MEDIYILVDPITNECRYVGKAKDSHKRFIRHIWEAKKPGRKKHLYCWIKSLLDKGEKPIQVVIDTVEDWKYWEAFYIEYYGFLGCNLTNLSVGGQGSLGAKHTEEWKQMMSDKFKGRKPWNTGKTLTKEHREAMSSAHKGRKFSEESKKKIGKANAKAHQKKSKLSISDIKHIRSSKETNKILALRYGIDSSQISRIKSKKAWKNV